MNKVVSVIVLTYNSEATVIETLDSVYFQSYPHMELIIADDASKDNTVTIVKDWLVNKKDRFRSIICNFAVHNHGTVKNINNAVKKSTGECIQIIAGDDVLLKDALMIKMNNLSNAREILISKVELFGDPLKCEKMQKWCNDGYEILKKDQKIIYKQLLIDNYIAGPSWGFIPAKVYDDIGLYDERFPLVEDYPFLVKLVKNGYELKFIDEYTAKYRISATSVCQTSVNYGFRDSMDDFFHIEKKYILLKKHMYYQYFWQNIQSMRYHILRKRQRKTVLYRISAVLLIFNPPLLLKYISNVIIKYLKKLETKRK